jgi:hypothetical protein
MTARCVYEDPKSYKCSHQERARIGDLAKFFGKEPACLLLSADRCPYQKPEAPPQPGDNAILAIGRNRHLPEAFMEQLKKTENDDG